MTYSMDKLRSVKELCSLLGSGKYLSKLITILLEKSCLIYELLIWIEHITLGSRAIDAFN